MDNQREIANLADVQLLVDRFYTAVREDELIGPIFDQVIGDNWGPHLQKMYGFWQTMLFGVQGYKGSPFPPHAKLPIAREHFQRWLDLWRMAIDSNFTGKVAEEAKWRGDKMAEMFLSKLSYYTGNSATPLI